MKTQGGAFSAAEGVSWYRYRIPAPFPVGTFARRKGSSGKCSDLSSFDTGKVQSMSAMFAGCRSLTSLNLSGFTTKKNPTLYKMFQGVGRLNTFVCSDEAIVRAYRNG